MYMTSHSYIMSYMMHTNLNGRCQRKGCIVLRIKVSFIFRHTYVFAMEDTEVQNKILYREKTLQWYSHAKMHIDPTVTTSSVS